MKRTLRITVFTIITVCAILFTTSCALLFPSSTDTSDLMTKDEVNKLIAGIEQNVTVSGGNSYNVTINSTESKNLLAASKALLSAVSITCTFKVTVNTIFHNDSGVFRDDWCVLRANASSPCIFTKGIDLIRLPLRHGEGKFVADPATLKQIEAKNLVAFRYANADGSLAEEFPANPNGSLNSIAGICDETGRVFGLMPHPEAFLSPYNSPTWTADQLKGELPKEGDGVAIFRNAVEYLA